MTVAGTDPDELAYVEPVNELIDKADELLVDLNDYYYWLGGQEFTEQDTEVMS
jgi:hypothetical protein